MLADCYGASYISDAYIVALSIPTILFAYIGHALSATFIPIYTTVKTEKGEEEAKHFSNKMMTLAILASTFFVVLILCFPRVIISVFAKGFSEEQITLASDIICISSITVYFMTAINILSARLQIEGKFYMANVISLPRNICLIFSVILSTKFGLWWLGFGIVLAYVGELVFLLPSIIKNKITFSFDFRFKDANLKKAIKMMGPIFVSVSVNEINSIVNKTIASIVIVGGISSLYYANLINTALLEVLLTSIIVVIFTNVSQLVAEDKLEEVDNVFHKSVRTLRFVVLPATIGMAVLAEPIISVMFGRGAFDAQAIALTIPPFLAYAVGICFTATRDILIKVFYAYKNTKTTFIVSVIGILINLGLNLVLPRFMGVAGLALSASISIIVQYLILIIYYRAKMWKFSIRSYGLSILKPLIGSIIMGATVLLIDYYLLSDLSVWIRLGAGVCVGCIVYFIAELVLKAKELKFFTSKVPILRKIIK